MLASIWLSGCASQPDTAIDTCVQPDDSRLAGQFALDVKRGNATHHLLVVNRWQEGRLEMIGFNAVGAKLFSAQVVSGQVAGNSIQAQSERFYRGPQARQLLWGLLVHQLRGDLQTCVTDDRLTVDYQPPALRLQRKDRLLFASPQPGEFALPPRDLRVTVRRLQ